MAIETATAADSAPAAEKPIATNPPSTPPPPPAELSPKKSYFKAAAALISSSISFKEESNVVADLEDLEEKALSELKQLLLTALANKDFSPATPDQPPAKPDQPPAKPADVSEAPLASPTETPEAPPAKTDDTPTVEEAAVTKPITDDDDGAKTVEAIEETVVAVAAAAAPAAAAASAPEPAAPESVSIYGVPLIGDDRSDTVLLKFLRARDFKPAAALAMIKNAVAWTKSFNIDSLLDEDLGVPEFEKAVFMHGVDREGHPVCYNVYGEFQDKDLYAKAFGDTEKRQRFLRWRIQFLEKGIRQLLDLNPGGVSTMVQVTDLGNSPGLMKRELSQALQLLQDNYPEFAAKQVFINVPWWYLAFNKMISPFFTARTKSKFVFAGPTRSAETLFKYISPAQVPIRFGGLSVETDSDFTSADAATEMSLRPAFKQLIEIPVTEACVVVLEVRVVGWDVVYGVEFVPSSEDAYTVILQKERKLGAEETVVKGRFKVGEAGKVVLTVDNISGKKKLLLHRYKVNSLTEEKEKN